MTGARPRKPPGVGWVWDGLQWVQLNNEQEAEIAGYLSEPPIRTEPPLPEFTGADAEIEDYLSDKLTPDQIANIPQPGTEWSLSPEGQADLQQRQAQETQVQQARTRRDVLFGIMKDVFPDMTDLYEGLTSDQAVKNLLKYTQERPEEFISDVRAKGRSKDTEALLMGMGATWDEVNQFFGAPLLTETPDALVQRLKTEGRTKENEALLLSMGATPAEVNQIFSTQKVVTVDGIRKLVTVTDDNNVYDENGNWLGFYDWADHDLFNPYKPGKGLGGKFLASITAGIGDVLSTSAGAARWLGQEEIGSKLSKAGIDLQRYGVPDKNTDFQVADLLDPEFYATKMARTVPFSLSLAPVAVAAFYGAGALAAAAGLGAVGTYLVSAIGSGALSRAAESALEAGGQYDDAIARGKTEAEAKKEADEVFRNNMTLAGADAWEIGIMLAPTPKWIPKHLLDSGLVTATRVGGKMVITGLSQGGEEIYQNMVDRHARGEEWKLAPEDKEVFAIGAIMGLGMGLGGDVVQAVVNKAETSMPTNLKNIYDKTIAGGGSELQALNDVAKTPEGQSFMQRLVEEAKNMAAEQKGEIVPEAEPGKAVPSQETLETLARNAGEALGKKEIEALPFEKGGPVIPKAEVKPTIPIPEAKATQAEYSQKIKPYLEQAEVEIKKANDEFMAGKYSLAENQAQRDAINANLDKQADRIRAEMGVKPATTPIPGQGIEAAKPVSPEGISPKEVVPPAEVLKDYPELARTASTAQMKQAGQAAGAASVPPVKPPAPPPQAVAAPEPKQSPLERIKQTRSEIEADINIARKKIAEIKTPLPTQGADVQFAKFALNDATRLARQSENIIKRLEKGQEVSEDEIASLKDRIVSLKDFFIFEGQAKIADIQATTKDKIASLKDWAKYTTEEQSRVKNILTHYVQAHVPLEERGKLLDAVKNVSNQEQLNEVLARADRIAEVAEQKHLKVQITKELKKAKPRKVEGIVKGRFGGEMQAELDILSRNISMNRDEALAKITTNLKAYDEGQMPYEDMLRDNAHLSLSGIDGMTSAELQETLDYIKSIKEIGRATRLVELEKFKEAMETAKKDIIQVVTGGKEVEPGVIKEFAGLKGLLKRIEGGQVALTDFLDILSGTDKTSKPYSSTLNHFVDDRVIKSYNAEQEGLVDSQTKVKDNFMRIFEVKKDREANDILRKMGREKVNLGTFKNTEGKTVKLELTKGQIIDAYNLMQAKENLDTFKEGNKYTPEMMKAINDSLTAQEKSWADWQRSYLADYWQGINDVYESLYGVKLGRNENYWPRNRDIERSDVPEHILVQEDYNHFASVNNRSLKARTNNKIPFKFLDGNTKLIDHITQMEHFKAWAFTIRDLRTVFMSKNVRDVVNQFYGQDILRKLGDYINVMARGGIEKSKRIHILDTLRGNVAVAQLGIKPMIAIKQPLALLGYATEMPYADFVSGVVDFLKNPTANYKTLYEKSAGLRARYRAGQYERDIKVGVEGGAPRSISGKATWKENVLTLIQMGDKFGTVPGMWAKYKSGLKVGLSEEQAILEAEKLTNRTQNTSQLFTLTTIQHGGSLARLLTMFQDQPNKYFRLINSNFRNLLNGRQGITKSISNIVLLWVVMPALFQWMSDAFKWRPERQARAVILGPVNQLLIFGQMAQSVVGWVMGEKFPYQPSPVLEIMDDIQIGFGKIQKLIRDGADPSKEISMDDIAEMAERFVKAGGSATGVPTPYLVQIEKSIRGQEGKRDWRELLFGRWALEEPKMSLKEQATEEGNKLGILKEITGEEAADKVPEIYDMADYWSKQKANFNKTLPRDITEENGFDKRSVAFGKALMAYDEYTSLPDKALNKIVDDLEKDDNLNYSVMQYYNDWQERSKITSLAKLKEYDDTHPRAFRGNLTQSQLALLLQYEGMTKEERKKFLAENEALKLAPRDQWLHNSPEKNALLAVHDQAKVLTQKAYDEAQSLIKELDLPDNAVEDFLPPKDVAKPYFDYQDAVDKYAANSPQARLVRAQNGKMNEWLKLEPIDESVKGLELKVKTYGKSKEYAALSDRDSVAYLSDVKDPKTGKSPRDLAQEKLKADNPKWVEDLDRIEAYSAGNEAKPVAEDIVNKWVKHGQISRESKGYDAEEKLFYIDNPEVHKWALDNKLTADDGSKWNEPALRITAGYRKQDEAYDALPAEGEARTQYLSANAEYRQGRRERDAYTTVGTKGEKFTGDQVQTYVDYYELPESGFRRERLLLQNPDFAQAMHTVKGMDIPTKVPSAQYDDIYDQYKPTFDQLEGLSNYKSKFYIADETARKAARDKILADTEIRDAVNRREAYGLFLDKTGHVDDYVAYYGYPDAGAERELYYKEHPQFEEQLWIANHPDADKAKYVSSVANKRVDGLKIQVQFKDKLAQYASLSDPESPNYKADSKKDSLGKTARDRAQADMLKDKAFLDARRRIEAYDLSTKSGDTIPDNMIEDYVSYYKATDLSTWEGERYLKSHPKFYDVMFKVKGWKDRIAFSKTPTAQVESEYKAYQKLITAQAKNAYLVSHRELEDWLILRGDRTKRVSATGTLPRDTEAARREALWGEAEAKRSILEEKLAAIR